jgi:TfoX/Sxy family transcriptional regulator of competence genes
MAQPYFDRLTDRLRELKPPKPRGVRLECKHFFGGAALYADGTLFASLTPAGLAVKLPEQSRSTLLRERRGRPLRYFERGPIKKEYVVLSRRVESDSEAVRELFRAAIRHVTVQAGASS